MTFGYGRRYERNSCMKQILLIGCIVAAISCRNKDAFQYLPVSSYEPYQTFTIASDRDTTVVGAKGTRLTIRANSFKTTSGADVKGSIEIRMKEFYTINDFIDNRLSTNTTDGRILRSSGMVFLEALSDTSKLSLKSDHPVTLRFRRVQDSRTANLFSGSKGAFGEIQWTLLEPVHHDTIVIRKQTITRLSYGEESVHVTYDFVIGPDTVELTDENEPYFARLIDFSRQSMRAYDSVLVTEDRNFEYSGDSFEGPIDSVLDPDRSYIFETTALGYVNCDIFIDERLFEFIVKVDHSLNDTFIVLDSLNSVLFPNKIDSTENEYTFFIPKGKSISVVAYSKEGDRHYLGVNRSISNDTLLHVTQVEMSREKIGTEIKKLAR